MSGNSIGHVFKLTTFGESHGSYIGGVVEGCPSGLKIDFEAIQNDLDRRKPGQSKVTTSRKETDIVEFISGIFKGKTTGTPIAFLIKNKDAKSKDYSELEDVFRPSHADYTYQQKYGLRDHLQMRIGIDTGFATVGNFGCESRLDYTAIGAAVNRASRLETAADNGSIYISEDTYNLVKDSIEAVALPPIHLKGIGEFQARKVIESKSTKSISMALGDRNVSFVLDNLTAVELESAKQSLEKALIDIDDFQDRSA